MGEHSCEFQRRFREELQRATELQSQLETKENDSKATRKERNEFQRQSELFRGKQQRDTKLESQLETNLRMMKTLEEQLVEPSGTGKTIKKRTDKTTN